MYYLIKETLQETDFETCLKKEYPYVAILTEAEFKEQQEAFGFIIDVVEEDELETSSPITKAEVNYDSLTGSFAIPQKTPGAFEFDKYCKFVLDEAGIVFIDESDVASTYIQRIIKTKKWRLPSLERFLFDFIQATTKGDLALLEKYEKEMDDLEDKILKDFEENIMERLAEIRGELQDLKTHYEQLIDVCQEFNENENNFFKAENLRYFRLEEERIQRLQDLVASLRDYSMQLRDLYHYQLDLKQNKISTLLTVVATIFMPLTLIAGWYGMNFYNMPELTWSLGYPVIIILSIIISIVEIIFFKKKKWL